VCLVPSLREMAGVLVLQGGNARGGLLSLVGVVFSACSCALVLGKVVADSVSVNSARYRLVAVVSLASMPSPGPSQP